MSAQIENNSRVQILQMFSRLQKCTHHFAYEAVIASEQSIWCNWCIKGCVSNTFLIGIYLWQKWCLFNACWAKVLRHCCLHYLERKESHIHVWYSRVHFKLIFHFLPKHRSRKMRREITHLIMEMT